MSSENLQFQPIADDSVISPRQVRITELASLKPYDKVIIVNATVTSVGEVGRASYGNDGAALQSVTIEDCSAGSCQVTLWGKYIGMLSKGSIYSFKNLMVKFFNGEVQLTTPKSIGVEITQKNVENEEVVLDTS